MWRSSSEARVSEGDGASALAAGHHHDDTTLPTYDPRSAARRREAARAHALECAVNYIPLLLLLCALVLWLSTATSPLVHLVSTVDLARSAQEDDQPELGLGCTPESTYRTTGWSEIWGWAAQLQDVAMHAMDTT